MARSCDKWCHFHISVTRADSGFKYLHRVVTAERTPRPGRAVQCHSFKMRSVYETPAYVAEETSVVATNQCEHRKVLTQRTDGLPCRNRFFVEIRQTPNAQAEMMGFTIPDVTLPAYDACCILNPFPNDVDVLCYIASHKDLIAAFGDDIKQARDHYDKNGRKEGRTITFEPLRYIASHSDLFAFGTDKVKACEHFIHYGHREVRPITFDPLAYLAANPELIESIPLDEERIIDHYTKAGHKEGRHRRAFPWRSYFQLNPDLLNEVEYNRQSAIEHFVRKGYKESRRAA